MQLPDRFKKCAWNIVSGLFLALPSFSQIPEPPKTVQSPNNSHLGIFGDFEVSLFTGKPEITVSLQTLESGPVSLPLALIYDASGVRPDIHPGWTGMNWGLSTHYAVIRTVKDAPDEGLPSSPSEPGYLHAPVRNALNFGAADWAATAKLENLGFNAPSFDMEPDEFSFNAPGLSGKFVMGHDGQWKVFCDQAVKVELISSILTDIPFKPPYWTGNLWNQINNGKYNPTMQGFYITDESGAKYEFGGSTANMEFSIDFFNQGKANWICNSWHLKSITRHTGQSINFSYERGSFVAQMYFSIFNKAASVNGGGFFGCGNWSSLINEYGAYNGKLISPIYLKEIVSDNFKVKFISSESTELRYTDDVFTTYVNKLVNAGGSKLDFLTFLHNCYYPVYNQSLCNNPAESLTQLLAKLKWRKLDKIQIANGGGSIVKEFELTYNNVATERLMLQKVQEKSGYNASKLPAYEFFYFSAQGLSLPGYCKSHTDHWGFYNGKAIDVANDFNAVASYGNTHRTPAVNKNIYRLGSLTQIKFPTSGITKFWFEPHTYAKEVKLKRWEGVDAFATNQVAGGLRIKEIHSYDPASANPPVKKKYYYLSGFDPANADTTSLLSSGVLGGKTQYYWPNYMPKPDAPNATVSEQIFSTQSVLPATENSLGAHIGYTNVIEWASTDGWNVHTYSNFENGYADSAPTGFIQPGSTPYQPYNSNAFKRGKLLALETYTKNGTPVAKTTYQYEAVGNIADYSARSVKTALTTLCNTRTYCYEGTAYFINMQKFLPVQHVSVTYDQDSPLQNVVSATRSYQYWPNGQLHIQGQPDSKGKEIKTAFTYPSNQNDAISIAMTAKNLIGAPTSVFKYTGPELAPVGLTLRNVKFDLFNGFYLPKKVESGIGTAKPMSMTTDLEFLTYDSRGNLQTYKERNGSITKLEYYGPAELGKVDLLKTRTVAEGSALAQSTAYNHKPLIGIESSTDANAKSLFYEYDDFNRLKSVRTGNAGGTVRKSYCYNYSGQVVECAALAPKGSIAASGLVLLAEQALPVTLVEFLASKQEKKTILKWSTTSETNSERFDIQRSQNGKNWFTIGWQQAMGTSDSLKTYLFTDASPLQGENLYRLKMVDNDSTFSYSRLQSVVFDTAINIALYPNPITVGENLNVLTDDLGKIANIRIFDTSGTLMHESAPARAINISKLPSGLYMVQITCTDGSISTHRVMKQ
ncbi:T9SS type A sorting domain-containing protein [Dyadobacter sp. CY351]|uniref:T9SS type A sorting domain-containing protein n=1 Tax=Dyadobacter sp. CY351 TaxID=2909337 RepID=UPI001F2CF797|nr:T9SS type A sorting domain-containing protein [Dyadobacter sp. CY351]MCF2516029.1 T9SS type A sorting domain-containing protein [Dyadobacter sp. CY351]